MGDKIKKSIITIILISLLVLNFSTNIFAGKDEVIGGFYTFETYQSDSEYLVFCEMFQDKYFEDQTGFGLIKVHDENGNRFPDIWNKVKDYNFEQKVQFEEYNPQFGLQGHVFSFLYNKLHMPFWSLKLICCVLLAGVVLGICYCIYKKYNKLMAVIFYITFLLSPWVVAFARNLYWAEFTWFLPILFGMLLSLDYSKWKIYVPCIFGAILIKCLCGYEYISTIMLGTIALFIVDFFMAKNKEERIKIFKTILIVGIVCILAFGIALCIHAVLRGEGNILEGLQKIYKEDVLRRTIIGVNADEFPEEYRKSLEAGVLETVGAYFIWRTNIILGIEGKYFNLMFVATLAIVIYNILTKNKDCYKEMVLFLVFLASTLSWLILGKSHSYVHVHMNYVLWYFGFIQISLYLIIKFISEKITEPLLDNKSK